MSLIGPRPESPEFVAARPADFDEILTVRPGIAGLSQLAFAAEGEILRRDDPVADYLGRILPQKCAIDRLYVREGTVPMDLKIAFWTAATVLLRAPVSVDRRTGALRRRRRPSEKPEARPDGERSADRERRFGAPVRSANGSAAGSKTRAPVPLVGARAALPRATRARSPVRRSVCAMSGQRRGGDPGVAGSGTIVQPLADRRRPRASRARRSAPPARRCRR